MRLNTDVIGNPPHSTQHHDMNLLSLNDDILIDIFSFLYGRDALHMSLTSWRAHDLAISRVSSTAICRTPDHVIRMHKYMLGPAVGKSGPRARYLHMLNISYMAFNRWCTQLPDASHRDGASALNTSMAKLVDEILIQATNLRSLSIDMLSICIKVDHRVRNALASMARLTNLRMWLVADTTLQRTIHSLPKSLSRVIFHCRHTSLGAITLPPFLSALSVLPNLRSITLCNFEPPPPFSPATLPLLPSVRHLRLEKSWESALTVADCCPGLETLKVSLSRCPQEPLQSARRWPSLLQLTVADQLAWKITHRNCVSSVHALELGDVFPVSSIPPLPDIIHSGFQNTFEHVYDALSLIFCTRPSALRVAIRVSKTGFNGSLGVSRPTILEDIAAVAPQLRALDLVLKPAIIQRWRDMLVRTPVESAKHCARADPIPRIGRAF